MSGNLEEERLTHFQSFAKLVMKELYDDGLLDLYNHSPVFHAEERVIETIAQRAYDLVNHAIGSLWPYINDRAIDPSATDIPDMTEFPKD